MHCRSCKETSDCVNLWEASAKGRETPTVRLKLLRPQPHGARSQPLLGGATSNAKYLRQCHGASGTLSSSFNMVSWNAWITISNAKYLRQCHGASGTLSSSFNMLSWNAWITRL